MAQLRRHLDALFSQREQLGFRFAHYGHQPRSHRMADQGGVGGDEASPSEQPWSSPTVKFASIDLGRTGRVHAANHDPHRSLAGGATSGKVALREKPVVIYH